MAMRSLLALAVILRLGSGPSVAAEAAGPLVIQNVRIFDGSRVIPSGTVVVQDGKIASVGRPRKVPAGAELVDGSGMTLLPGLIDSHTHTFGAALRQALIFGVTTELDMFTEHHMAAIMRGEQAAGGAAGRADLFSAGTLVTAPGGHGTEYGMVIPTIEGPGQAQAFVDARLAEGSDYIKIVYDDGRAYGMSSPTISKETMAAVIAAAHKRGKLAVVHIGTLEGARDAIESGADGLVHLFLDKPMDAAFAADIARHRAFVIPTLTVLGSVTGAAGGAALAEEPELAQALSAADVVNLKKTFPVRTKTTLAYAHAEESVRKLQAAKVPILAGSDAPNPGTLHGATIHHEMELLVRAGMTPLEALAAATAVPAARFKLPDRGGIARGKRADLLLVHGDPTTDIRATRRIARIWKQGVPVDRGAYIAEIESAKAASESAGRQPEPRGSESGLVSDFEDGKPSAQFGSGWSVSTDSIAGGKSVGDLEVVAGGANQSRGSLSITGEIRPGAAYAWSGAMFSPGDGPMAPANLSSKKEISFWAKGDGKEYRVMLFATSQGYMPAIQSFVTGPEWKQFTFPISSFNGMDGSDLNGIFFGGGPEPGSFSFQIDEVRLP